MSYLSYITLTFLSKLYMAIRMLARALATAPANRLVNLTFAQFWMRDEHNLEASCKEFYIIG